MGPIFLSLALLGSEAIAANPALAQLRKMSPERLQGMREAVADIENGILAQRLAFPFAPPSSIREYIDFASKECGIDFELTRDCSPLDDGYNDVMLRAIEQRFGRGILSKLAVRFETEQTNRKNQ